MRTVKVGGAFYEIITALELDGQTPITGLAASDFTLNTYRNGTAESVNYTFSEIGSGHYLFTLSSGFSTSGYRMLTTLIEATGVLQRTDIQVSTKDIDDVFTAVSGLSSTSGINTVTFTVQDATNNNATVPATDVKVYNVNQTAIISFGETNANGTIDINLDPATYVVKTFKAGYAGSNTTVVVADAASQNQTLSISSIFVEAPAPSTPSLCRLFVDFIDLSGAAEVGKQITVSTELLDTDSGLVVAESTTYTSNSSGRIEFDAIQEAYISVSIVGAGITRTVQVPALSNKSLADLMQIRSSSSSVADSGLFVVVT